MTKRGWDTYVMFVLMTTWPALLVLGVVLYAGGHAWAIGFLCYCAASAFGMARLAVHFWRHGLDNHFCGRSCCGGYR